MLRRRPQRDHTGEGAQEVASRMEDQLDRAIESGMGRSLRRNRKLRPATRLRGTRVMDSGLAGKSPRPGMTAWCGADLLLSFRGPSIAGKFTQPACEGARNP